MLDFCSLQPKSVNILPTFKKTRALLFFPKGSPEALPQIYKNTISKSRSLLFLICVPDDQADWENKSLVVSSHTDETVIVISSNTEEKHYNNIYLKHTKSPPPYQHPSQYAYSGE